MATQRVYGPNGGSHWASYIDYSTEDTNTRFNVNFSGGWHTGGWRYDIANVYTSYGWEEGGTEHRYDYKYVSVSEGSTGDHDHQFWSKNDYFTKGHSPRRVSVWVYCNYSGSFADARGSSQAQVYFDVPAKTNYSVGYDPNGGTGSIEDSVKWYDESLILSNGIGFSREGKVFYGWNTQSDGQGTHYNGGASYTANEGAMLYATWDDGPSGCTNTRNNDNQNFISWSNGQYGYLTIRIERSVDGGQFSEIGYTNGTAESYTDFSASADHSYTYRVRAQGWNGEYSGYSVSNTTVNTPSAPGKPVGSRISSGVVGLVIPNASSVATGIDLQYLDSGVWVNAGSFSGSPVTYCEYSTSGVYSFRVRNTNAAGASEWSEPSEPVGTAGRPNPPTLIEPASGVVLSSSSENIVFSIIHNPIDGSSQTAGQVQISGDGFQTITVDMGSDSSCEVASSTLLYPSPLTWKARTQGVSEEWSEWSDTRTFQVAEPPSVSITEPASQTVSSMPLTIAATMAPTTGTMRVVASRYDILENGKTVFTTGKVDGNLPSVLVTADRFTPVNGGSYTISVTARAATALVATETMDIVFQFTEPKDGVLRIDNDSDTGYTSLTADYDYGDAEGAEVSYIDVIRDVDGSRKTIIEGAQPGTTTVDKYAPLNRDYKYIVVTHAPSGSIKSVEVANRIESDRFFVYWEGNIAYGIWNPTQGGIQLTRPEKRRVHYVGRDYPVSYDSRAIDEKQTPSFLLIEGEHADMFRQLMEDGGRGVYKSCDGLVFNADFSVSESPDYQVGSYYGNVRITVDRIAGEQL